MSVASFADAEGCRDAVKARNPIVLSSIDDATVLLVYKYKDLQPNGLNDDC